MPDPDPSINLNDNYGYVAGRDIIINVKQTSWIEAKKSIKNINHHFKIFFSLISDINKPNSKLLNTIQHAQSRMKREFLIVDDLKPLTEKHQAEVYEMYDTLMNLKHSSECTEELIKDCNMKLTKISQSADYSNHK
jgi:hypothetical protein